MSRGASGAAGAASPWFATAGAGLGVSTALEATGDEGGGALGWGAHAGVGREFQISPSWALGGVLRAQYLRTEDFDPIGEIFGQESADHRIMRIAALLSLSFD